MLRMQGNLVLLKMKRVWNGLCWRDSRVWRKFGKFKILQIRYYRNICLHLRHGIFRSCHSICWGFLATLMLQAKSNLCDFSLVRTETVYVMETAVFCTWLCSVIAAKEVSTRLLLSLHGTDVIDANFKHIFLAIVCSTKLLSKLICKRS